MTEDGGVTNVSIVAVLIAVGMGAVILMESVSTDVILDGGVHNALLGVVLIAVGMDPVLLVEIVPKDVTRVGGVVNVQICVNVEHATALETAQAVLPNNIVLVHRVDRVTVEDMDIVPSTVLATVRQTVLLAAAVDVLRVRKHFMQKRAIANISASVEETTHAEIQDFVIPAQ